jgi:hypothetical protein
MSIGREGAICEYIEIMQIPPGSSDDVVLIDASRAICNMASDALKSMIRKSMPSGLTRGWVPVFPRDKRGTRLRGDHAQTKR